MQAKIDLAELADEVLQRITWEHETFDQRIWYYNRGDAITATYCNEPGVLETLATEPRDWNCGTTACLAGHIISAALDFDVTLTEKIERSSIMRAARVVMDIPGPEHDAIDRMFSAERKKSEVTDWLLYVSKGMNPTDAVDKALDLE